jgi:hypothetical protein
MPSHWGMVNRLCRELGSLRDDARAIDPSRTEAAVVAEVDAALARAAAALDATIDTPEDSRLFVGACDALALARERIQDLQATARHSHALIDPSVLLRAASVRLMHESWHAESGQTTSRRA